MTAEAAAISITVKIEKVTKRIEKTIDIEKIEQEASTLIQKLNSELLTTILETLDDALREGIPKGWQNVGREERRILLEQGYVVYCRRIYKDEKGQRHKRWMIYYKSNPISVPAGE